MPKLPTMFFQGGGLSPQKIQTIVIVAAVAIILLAVYKAGKSQQIPTLPLPSKGAGIPADWSQNQAMALVDEFERVTSFISFDSGADKVAIYSKLYALTPDQLTYCYNVYQKKYAQKDGWFSWPQTMYERVSNYFTGWLAHPVRNQLLGKMQALNLS